MIDKEREREREGGMEGEWGRDAQLERLLKKDASAAGDSCCATLCGSFQTIFN